MTDMPETPFSNPSYGAFLPEMEETILPIYQDHERHFDPTSIHGRLHICRALVFAEAMRYFYSAWGISINVYAVRTALAFHDSGRQDNGRDYWEHDSAALCREYLLHTSPFSDAFHRQPGQADWIASLIPHDGTPSLEKQILHDADVLEYMRLFSGDTWEEQFKQERLLFASPKDAWKPGGIETPVVRYSLIQEAWEFITLTGSQHAKFANFPARYCTAMLKLLSQHAENFPLLSGGIPDLREINSSAGI